MRPTANGLIVQTDTPNDSTFLSLTVLEVCFLMLIVYLVNIYKQTKKLAVAGVTMTSWSNYDSLKCYTSRTIEDKKTSFLDF